MNNKRKICVVTGSRAEYGLLYWLIKYMSEDTTIELQLIVTGMHLSTEFGLTYKVIENDGFKINKKVECLLSADTKTAISKSVALGLIGFSDAFNELNPDIVVLLGDRFEIFAVAQAALVLNIPIAHIHGGEVTEGAIDEAFRHSITKMSHLHFVATEEYRKRVIQLGEQPKFVFNYGSPGIDNIHKINILSKEALEIELGIKFGETNFLVTYHPVTLYSYEQVKAATDELLQSLDAFPDAHIFFTNSNADQNGQLINKVFAEFVSKNKHRCVVHVSLGQKKFLSLLSYIDVMLGNSSSALIEAAALKVPAINIGPRQDGRMKSSNVIDCDEKSIDIVNTLKKVLNFSFKSSLASGYFPYGTGGDNSFKIYKEIKEVNLENILFKKFHDI